MDQKQLAKQMIEFNKSVFDNTFSAMTVLQDQTEKIFLRFLEKASWLPEEGKKALNDWLNTYKNGCDNFKATSDENYKKVLEYFAKAEKEEAAKK
jgi:hypothetical protein